MRIFTNRWFMKFARRQEISAAALRAAVDAANLGLIDADLGSGVIKQRIARDGEGKSGGYRALIFFQPNELAVFVFGFAKSEKAALDASELRVYKQAAKIVLALSPDQLDAEVQAERLFEVQSDAQKL